MVDVTSLNAPDTMVNDQASCQPGHGDALALHRDVYLWVQSLADRGLDRLPLPGDDRGRHRLLWRHQRDRSRRKAVATRKALAHYLGRDWTTISLDRTCARCGHPTHGKPRVVPRSAAERLIDFNAASSADVFVFAVTQGTAVGVDVEAAAHARHLRELALMAETSELGIHVTSLAAWTQHEALLKMAGLGLTGEPTEHEAALMADAAIVHRMLSDSFTVCVATAAPRRLLVDDVRDETGDGSRFIAPRVAAP